MRYFVLFERHDAPVVARAGGVPRLCALEGTSLPTVAFRRTGYQQAGKPCGVRSCAKNVYATTEWDCGQVLLRQINVKTDVYI